MAPAFPQRLRWAGRVGALAIAFALLAGLATAAHVVPDESGLGTHRQLGLRPCDFVRRVGLPCPTCGMTTAAALLVRGRIIKAMATQPLGALLTVAAGVAFWACLYAGITGRPIYRLFRAPEPVPVVAAIGFLAAGAWLWKIALCRGILRV